MRNSTERRFRQLLPYRSILLRSNLLLAICLFTASTPLRPMLAQTATQTNHAPSGWFLAGSKPASYRTGVDKELIRDGQPSAYLVSAPPVPNGFGTLMQSISATNYAGKRVRLRASIQSQNVGDWAGIWLRADQGQTAVAFDNMQNRAIKGTQSWTSHDVVLDIPKDATGISFGVLLSGPGEVWVNHMTLEIVDQLVAVTSPGPSPNAPLSATPVNLNFKD
jgi:hypothetical protein